MGWFINKPSKSFTLSFRRTLFLLNWVKAIRKLMNAGELKAERIELFEKCWYLKTDSITLINAH